MSESSKKSEITEGSSISYTTAGTDDSFFQTMARVLGHAVIGRALGFPCPNIAPNEHERYKVLDQLFDFLQSSKQKIWPNSLMYIRVAYRDPNSKSPEAAESLECTLQYEDNWCMINIPSSDVNMEDAYGWTISRDTSEEVFSLMPLRRFSKLMEAASVNVLMQPVEVIRAWQQKLKNDNS